MRLELFGRPVPVGNTVRKVRAVDEGAVTLSTTEPTPDDGTPPTPVTGTFTVPAGPTGVPVVLVSNTRLAATP